MDVEELQRKIADRLDRIGVLERNSQRIVIGESSKNRIEYLKDYTYIGLTAIGIIVTAIASKATVESFILLVVGLVLLLASTIYALIARAKMIDDTETVRIFIENQYAAKYEIVEQLAIAQTQEAKQVLFKQLDSIRDSKPPKQSVLISSAHAYILRPFIGGLIFTGLAFSIKTITAML